MLMTRGVTNSGFRASTSSWGMTVCVRRDPAVGTRALDRMLYLAPSWARELENPIKAALAKKMGIENRKGEYPTGCVVGLSEVSIYSSVGRSDDDSSVSLVLQIGPSGLSHGVGSLDVNLEDEVPVEISHLQEGDVAEDSSIVDDDI